MSNRAPTTLPLLARDPPALTLSPSELAGELRVSVKTITRMDQSGKLPAAFRVGHGKRWLRSTIIAWLADGCPCRREWEAMRQDAAMGRGRCRREA